MKRLAFFLALLAGVAVLVAQNPSAYTNLVNGAPVAKVSFLRSLYSGRNVLGDPTLIAWWPLTRGNTAQALDYSGNGNDAIWGNRAGTATQMFAGGSVAGKISSYCPYFSKAAIHRPQSAANISITAPFTISVWAKANVPNPNFARIVENNYLTSLYLGTNVSGTYGDWEFVLKGFFISTGSTTAPTTSNANTPAVVTGAWTMVTGTYDGTSMYLYVNGGSTAGGFTRGPITGATNPGTINLPISIGGCPNGTGSTAPSNGCSTTNSGWWDGEIQDVRIYSRALHAAEIAAIYAAENH